MTMRDADKIRNVRKFLRLLGCKNINVGGSRVICSCPMAKYRHAGGTDDHPSFNVGVLDDGSVVFNCFACGISGKIASLPHMLFVASKRYPYRAMSFLVDSGLVDEGEFEVEFEDGDKAILSRETIDLLKEKKIKNLLTRSFLAGSVRSGSIPVPEGVLNKFPILAESKSVEAVKVIQWLEDERNIAFEVIEKYELRLYAPNPYSLGVVFPIKWLDGKVYDLWYRLIDDKKFRRITPHEMGSHIEWGTKTIPFGAQFWARTRPVILVEGAIDALRLATLNCSFLPLATMGPPSDMMLKSLASVLVVLGFDADDQGRRFAEKAKQVLCREGSSVFYVDWGVVGCKDPGELESVEQLETAMKRFRIECSSGSFRARMFYDRYLWKLSEQEKI